MAANPALLFRIDGDASGFNQAAMQVQGNVTKLGNVFNDVFASGIAQDALYALTNSLKSGATAVFDYTSKLEQTKVGFTTLMKNADLAASHIAELEKLSRSTPLKFENIATMSQRLQGAGIEAVKIIPLIKDIGNVAAATGELSAERMEGIGVAFSQILSKGKVSAEEMEQLAERGIPAWKILSESINKTAAETRKMAEDGKISGQQMLEAFQKFSRANFGDAMQKQANTFSGSIQQIQNVIVQSASKLFKPIYDEVGRFTSKVAQSLKEQEAALKRTGVSFGFAFGEAFGGGAFRGFQASGYIAQIGRLLAEANQGFPEFRAGFAKGWTDAKNPMPKTPDYSRPDYDKIAADRQKKAKALDDKAADDRNREYDRQAEEERRRLEDLGRRDYSAALGGANNNLQLRREDIEESVTAMLAKLDEWGSGDNVIKHLNKDFERLKNNLDLDLAALEAIENQQRSLNTVEENRLLTQNQRIRRDNEEKSLAEAMLRFNQGVADFNDKEAKKDAERFETKQRQQRALMELEEMRRLRQLEIDTMLSGVVSNLGTPTMSTEGASMAPFGEGGFMGGMFSGLGTSIEQAAEPMNRINQIGQMLGSTFMQVGQAVGEAYKSFILMGTAGTSFRKLAAEVIASIAQMSIVQAVFELAQGFAMLGLAWFTGNPKYMKSAKDHFISAAVFGSIAGVAGGIGRGVAGNSFQNSTSGGGGGSGGDGDADNGNRPGLAFTTRFNGFLTSQEAKADRILSSIVDKSNSVMGRVGQQIDNLASKLESMSPGDVVTVGAGSAANAIFQANLSAIQGDGSKATELKRGMGDYS
jgi:tape measure domain-containing protein